jgi:hypothetical protein
LLFFAICALGFGLLIAFTEALLEIRHFIRGQLPNNERMKELDDPVTPTIYYLAGISKYARILNSFCCLTAGSFFYLIRHSIVMLAIGNLTREHLFDVVEKRVDSFDYNPLDVSFDKSSMISSLRESNF